MSLLTTIAAYGVGALAIAPLVSGIGEFVNIPLTRAALNRRWLLAIGSIVGAMLAYSAIGAWFNWLKVPYGALPYFACMIPVIINDARRAVAGETPAYLVGVAIGMLLSAPLL